MFVSVGMFGNGREKRAGAVAAENPARRAENCAKPGPMRLIRTPLTWYAYLLSGFFTFIINIQGNIIPFLRDELRLSYPPSVCIRARWPPG